MVVKNSLRGCCCVCSLAVWERTTHTIATVAQFADQPIRANMAVQLLY